MEDNSIKSHASNAIESVMSIKWRFSPCSSFPLNTVIHVVIFSLVVTFWFYKLMPFLFCLKILSKRVNLLPLSKSASTSKILRNMTKAVQAKSFATLDVFVWISAHVTCLTIGMKRVVSELFLEEKKAIKMTKSYVRVNVWKSRNNGKRFQKDPLNIYRISIHACS